jgi:hypothetical protein
MAVNLRELMHINLLYSGKIYFYLFLLVYACELMHINLLYSDKVVCMCVSVGGGGWVGGWVGGLVGVPPRTMCVCVGGG